MNQKTIVHEDLCIGCGQCKRDCVACCIEITNGKARIREELCVGCGHCYAVCPKNAVELRGWGEGGGEPVSDPVDSDALLGMMKSRRSTRQFQDKAIEPEVLEKILEAGRYAPTAENHQVVEYILLDSHKDAVEAKAVKQFRKAMNVLKKVIPQFATQEIDDHFFFKGAPLVILVTNKMGMDDGLAASYIELMANSLGLGVLYSGFFRVAVKLNPRLRAMLPIRKGYHLTNCMVIGYPNVKYQRVPPRYPAKLKRY